MITGEPTNETDTKLPLDKEVDNPSTPIQQVSLLLEDLIVSDSTHPQSTFSWNKTNVDRSNKPGARMLLCDSSLYVVDLARILNSESENLFAAAINSQTIAKALPPEINDIYHFRRHGFAIFFDHDERKWFLVDRTLHQFVEENDDQWLMEGSGLNIEESAANAEASSNRVGLVAHELLDNGFVELDAETLSAYLLLMTRQEAPQGMLGELIEQYTVSENHWLQEGVMTMFTSCLSSNQDNSTTGDMSGILNHF